MSLGDIPLGEDDIVALYAPDGNFGLIELQALLFSALLCDNN